MSSVSVCTSWWGGGHRAQSYMLQLVVNKYHTPPCTLEGKTQRFIKKNMWKNHTPLMIIIGLPVQCTWQIWFKTQTGSLFHKHTRCCQYCGSFFLFHLYADHSIYFYLYTLNVCPLTSQTLSMMTPTEMCVHGHMSGQLYIDYSRA